MVFTDGIHLVAHNLTQLHEFAEQIGLKRHYYHGLRKGHPHYDLTNEDIRQKAIINGAGKMNSKEIVKAFQNRIFKF